jgi:hypothetical protein
MEKDETSFESPFAAAVNAIIDSHKKLYDILLTSFGIYNSGVVPPRTKRVSRILDCEANGVHTILESLATAAKAEPRGSLGAAPDLLIAECRDFLDFLEDNLKSPDCAATINDIRQTEEAFTNLIKGLSGCDPNITTEEYHKRIDKFIRDLKGLFRNLGSSIVKYEFTLSERAKSENEKRATSTRSKRGVGGKGPKTEFMKGQFKTFERFLTASRYDGEMKKLNSLAAQCWFKNKAKWDAAAKATGQNKGYSSAIVLANAYRRID